MKYCTKCGNQLLDEAVICPKCGCIADQEKYDQLNKAAAKKETSVYSSSIQSIALAFMIISTIIGAFFFFIPLAWCLPMTLHYNDCIKNKTPAS